MSYPDEACVWMRAGLVAWKLCDRQFQCETCPLEAALRPGMPAARPDHPADRRYGLSHTWVRLEQGGARVGLDHFAASLLCRPRTVALLPEHYRAGAGAPGAWILCGEETIPVHMPLSGVISRVNTRLAEHPWLATADPYEAGWLLELIPDEESPDLLDSTGMAEVTSRHEAWLRDEITSLAAHDSPVGATAADGGTPLPSLRTHLEASQWSSLVRRILCSS